jgi:hypothetical protein
MPIQGDQRASSPRSKIDRGRVILQSISGECRVRQGQRLVSLRVPKCEADSKPAGRITGGHHRPLMHRGHHRPLMQAQTPAGCGHRPLMQPQTQKFLQAFLRNTAAAVKMLIHHIRTSPDVIDVDQEASQAADSRMKELRKKWTAHVKKTQQGKDREEVQLPDPLIEKLETMIQNKKKRAKNVRTSWSLEDKRTVLAVFKVLNRK